MRNSRPRVVAEALSGLMPVDIVTTDWDHQSRSRRGEGGADGAPGYGGGRIHYLPTPAYHHHVSPARFLSHAVFSMRAARFFAARRQLYSLVYATVPLNLAAWRAFRAAGPHHHRVLDVVDIWPDVLPWPPAARRLAAPAFRVWRRTFELACASADTLLAVSDRFLEESTPHFRAGPGSAARFYIGHEPLRASGEREQVTTIAFVGNLGFVYDLATLVEALSAVAASHPVQLLVIGDGDRRDWLLEQLRSRAIPHRFFGPVWDHAQLAGLLGRAHLGFNGYINTTAAFSYKATTYMAAGLPLLNSMGGDLWQLVERRGIGFNYPAGDAAALIRLLRACTPERLAAASSATVEFFRDELDLSGVTVRLQRFLRDRIAAAGPRLADARL